METADARAEKAGPAQEPASHYASVGAATNAPSHLLRTREANIHRTSVRKTTGGISRLVHQVY